MFQKLGTSLPFLFQHHGKESDWSPVCTHPQSPLEWDCSCPIQKFPCGNEVDFMFEHRENQTYNLLSFTFCILKKTVRYY